VWFVKRRNRSLCSSLSIHFISYSTDYEYLVSLCGRQPQGDTINSPIFFLTFFFFFFFFLLLIFPSLFFLFSFFSVNLIFYMCVCRLPFMETHHVSLHSNHVHIHSHQHHSELMLGGQMCIIYSDFSLSVFLFLFQSSLSLPSPLSLPLSSPPSPLIIRFFFPFSISFFSLLITNSFSSHNFHSLKKRKI
jgi:hypothetical protein